MVAKGVDFYIYSDSDTDRTEINGPKFTAGPYGREVNFRRSNLQISSARIPGAGSYTGTLKCTVRRRNAVLMHQFQDINSLYGSMRDRGTMSNIFKTPPRLGDPTICWGYYHAGDGLLSPLTNQSQFHVYVTRNQNRWMTDLAARDPRIARGPFARFALPGAHDAGMYDMGAVNGILADPKLALVMIGVVALMPIIGAIIVGLARPLIPVAIANLAMTQKDDITTMLEIGTRYFDFRPGHMHPKVRHYAPGALFHQHGAIPGISYAGFLRMVLTWLDANPGEIVVVDLNTQGFADASMKPTREQLDRHLKGSIGAANLSRPIAIGDTQSLSLAYEELVRTNTRLIFIDRMDGQTNAHDSWLGIAYATLEPEPVINAFKAMGGPMPPGKDFTVMQMQATSTAMGAGVIVPAIRRATWASSVLMATKAVMDAGTIPWLRENAAKTVPPDHLLVLLNDFIDNCTVETAAMLTRQRARD
ncbi:MAG: hypothetical protein V4574_16070 [Pseudomonadota bacterium]